MYQPAPGKPHSEPTITVNRQRLQVVDKFSYLESTLPRAVHIDDEVTARIAKASIACGRLRGNVWDRNGIRLDTKLKVYKAVVLPALLYACETWTVYQRHAKRLNHFHLCCLRKLIKIRWQDKIPDTEVLTRAGMQSVHTLLKLECLVGGYPRWPEETLQRYPNSLPKGFQHTTRVLGTDWTGSSKVALPHQKESIWLWSKKNLWSRKKVQRAQSQSQRIIIRVVFLRIDLLYLQQTV